MSNARYATVTATIANGASLSGSVELDGKPVVAIIMPSSWTTASLTFQSSADGATYNDVYSTGGVETQYSAAASRYISVDPTTFLGAQKIKVRSGTTGSAVNQGAERIITLVIRQFE